jgi:hypothetical protein
MRSISAALLAHLQTDVPTVATLWLITRTDGQTFAYTDLDQPITYSGTTYVSAGGYTHSAIEMGSDLSTSNLQVDAIFDSSAITPDSLESGSWDGARVVCMLVNYNDLTMGAVTLDSGLLGQVTLMNGRYSAELRGLAQVMQQDQGQVYSPTCRATFGDSRCAINLAPLTFTGSVQSAVSAVAWLDSTLTQTGPVATYTDTRGQHIPTHTPYTIKVVPPTGGAFVANVSVTDDAGKTWINGGSGSTHYTVASDGTYTFDSSDAGKEVFISYTYTIGYFAYGSVKFTSGQNAGFSMEVKAFAPGVVTLAMALPYAIGAGDTYTITAGCDRQFGTCKNRWSNVVHFRGEPYIPGQDTILRPQGG